MATTLEFELTQLSHSDAHIADAERHIVEQEARVEQVRVSGQDVKPFEALLATFKETLQQHNAHRTTILDRIKRLEAAAAGGGETVDDDSATMAMT